MSNHFIELENRKFNFTLKKSIKTKCLRLSIKPNLGLEVRAPFFLTERQIFEGIRKKQKWILSGLNYCKKFANAAEDNIDEILHLGKKHNAKFHISNRKKEKIIFSNNVFYFFLKEDTKQKRYNLLIKWYRHQTGKIVLELIKKHYSILKIQQKTKSCAETMFFADIPKHKLYFEINNVSIKNQRTVWGSCSSKKNLNFNCKLAMVPPKTIEYVVIHELAHLQEMNHSKDFWQIVKKNMPDFKKHRLWLKNNAHLLGF